MFYIQIADITVGIDNRYEYVYHLCKNYIITEPSACDMLIRVTEEEIQAEQKIAEIQVSAAYAEGVCVYRAICKQLPVRFQSYLMHCAVIEYEGKGYAFAAKSGTGKSTHIALWQKRFGEAVHIVNGDKPIMRFIGDQLYAYGTPWCGKEGFNTNTSVPLHALCFLERSPTNSIRKIGADEAVMKIFHQILSPEDIATVDALFPLLDRTLRQIPCYVLGCNISEEAAEVAYSGMNQ
ncbi:MAG: hypothetical protein E7668_00585 [Ruminococcaceae bacterium]|nr:hypothetical protein [Oscillospiraceae bacterium]